MPFRVNCPNCQTAYSIPDDALGKTLRCKKCQKTFTVGKPKAAVPAPAKPSTVSAAKPATRAATDLTSRPPAKPSPRPAIKTPPRRETVQDDVVEAEPPKRRGKSRLLLIGAIVAGVFVLGGCLTSAIVASVYFFKKTPQTPIVANQLQQQVNAPEAKIEPPLPPDLDLVPGEGAIFISVQVAQLWKDPALAGLRKQTETDKNLAQSMRGLKMMGLDPDNLERAVGIVWGKKHDPYMAGLVTMINPYNRQAILALIGDDPREEKIGEKSVFSGTQKPLALYFLNERSFVLGKPADVKNLLELPPQPTRKAEWNEILRSSSRHTLLIGAQRDAIPPEDDPKKEVPPALLPLTEAHTAVVALDVGKDFLQLTTRFMFANDEQVKQGETAARSGLEMAAAAMGQFAEQFKKLPQGAGPLGMDKLIALIQAAENAVKNPTIQNKDRTLECQLRLESANWPEALSASAAMFTPAQKAPAPPPPGMRPRPRPKQPRPGRFK